MSVIEINDSDFEAVLKKDKHVLVDFFATWCGPCKMQSPVLEKIAGEFVGKATIYKIDIDNNKDSSTKYHVASIPTLILFKDGEAVNTMVGFQSEAVLKKVLSSL